MVVSDGSVVVGCNVDESREWLKVSEVANVAAVKVEV